MYLQNYSLLFSSHSTLYYYRIFKQHTFKLGFLGSSAAKESACNAGDPDSWVGKLPCRRDSLSTQVFLGFPGGSDGKESAIQETWVRPLGWEDPLEEGMATHSSTVAGRIPMDRGVWRATVHGVTQSQT